MSYAKLNKIGIIGTQCIGKTTLVDDMLIQWPQLTRPEKTYRDLIKKKKLSINKEGNKKSQEAILNFLVDEAMANYGKKKMIFDRTPIDNLVYSLWLYEKGTSDIDEADFIYISIPHINGEDQENPELFREEIEKLRKSVEKEINIEK